MPIRGQITIQKVQKGLTRVLGLGTMPVRQLLPSPRTNSSILLSECRNFFLRRFGCRKTTAIPALWIQIAKSSVVRFAGWCNTEPARGTADFPLPAPAASDGGISHSASAAPRSSQGDDRQLFEKWPNRETVENIGQRIRQLRRIPCDDPKPASGSITRFPVLSFAELRAAK